MMLSPLGIKSQRQRARQLAKRVRLDHATARLQTTSTYEAVQKRVAQPHSLAFALIAGMAVGLLAPKRRGSNSRRELISDNLAVKQLVRTARTFLLGRLFGAFNS